MISTISRRRTIAGALLAIAFGLALLAPDSPAVAEERFPDVVDVKITARGARVFDFDVTVSSPYDTPARYADAFRVATESGQVLGERKLLHDHQGEQPFTRDLYGIVVPPSITTVIVQAKDQKYGYGGKAIRVRLPHYPHRHSLQAR
jgi:hypothetical protein